MRRINPSVVAAAVLLLNNPLELYRVDAAKQEELHSKALHLVRRYGHLLNASKHPAELDRMARQRRRARQTHPGKRGRS